MSLDFQGFEKSSTVAFSSVRLRLDALAILLFLQQQKNNERPLTTTMADKERAFPRFFTVASMPSMSPRQTGH